MDILDQSTDPIKAIGEYFYVDKFNDLNTRLNKIIDEMISAKTYNSIQYNNIAEAADALVTNVLKNMISYGDGIDGTYDEETGILTIAPGEGGPDVPDVPDNSTYGGMKIMNGFKSEGMTGYATDVDLPAVAFAFDMRTMACKNVFQRYRIVSSMPNINPGEQDGPIIQCISGSYAISIDTYFYSQYAYITPYTEGSSLIEDRDDWAASYTLTAGTNLTPIDVSANYRITSVFLIGPGKLLLGTSWSNETQERACTFYIVDFVDEMTHTKIPIFVDLDALSISSAYYFYNYYGIGTPAFDYVTGELAAAVYLAGDSNLATLLIKIDPDTGDILSHLLVESPSTSTPPTPAAIFDAVTNETFDYLQQYRFGQFTIGSFDSVAPHASSSSIMKRTFSSRSINSAPEYNMLFNDEEIQYDLVSLDSSARDKLISLGYDIPGGMPSFSGFNLSVIFEDMQQRSNIVLGINSNVVDGSISYGWNSLMDFGSISGSTGSNTILQLLAQNSSPKKYVVLLQGTYSSDYLISLESENFSTKFLGSAATFSTTGGNSKWTWTISSLGSYDSLSTDNITIVTKVY